MSAFNILFIDIETIAHKENFADVDPRTQKIFLKKFNEKRKTKPMAGTAKKPVYQGLETDQELWQSNAALHAEFNKVIVVCVGIILPSKDRSPSLYVKTLTGTDEHLLLVELAQILKKNSSFSLCGHNGNGFDFPVLGRKFLIHGMELPNQLNVAGRKPWEVNWIDTQTLWGFTQFNAHVALDNLANCFGLESPKAILQDRSVHEIFYGMREGTAKEVVSEKEQGERLQKLGQYCAGDVVTLVNVYLRITGQPIIPQSLITII